METINIVFSSDNNYAQYMGVAICSIFENKTSPNPIDIYVLDGGISEDNKIKLNLLVKNYSFKINFVSIDKSSFAHFSLNGGYTQTIYYRIMIPKLLPQLSKSLYLDSDIIVINDIFELYRINIENYLLGAVEDSALDKTRHRELDIPDNEKYFNSGVLLLNICMWNKFDISEKVIEFIKNNPEKLKYPDQDAINKILCGRWYSLHHKYNYMISDLDKFPFDTNNPKKDVSIIHYTTQKPWDYYSDNLLNNKYFYYLKKTPWKNNKYVNKNLKTIIIKKAKRILPKKIIRLLKKYLSKIGFYNKYTLIK